MEKYKLNYLPIFKDDLKEITEYIAIDLDNKDASHQLTDNVLKKIELLKNNPEIYQEYDFIKPLKRKYRYFIVGNYIAFYTVDRKKKIITLYRILYMKRNLKSILK